jgi:aldehyde dehydrogenase (NAD+)
MTVPDDERERGMSNRLDHWIDGGSVLPASGRYEAGIDPATRQASLSVAQGSAADVDAAVRSASDAFGDWKRRSAGDRGTLLHDLATTLYANADELARLESQDTGKPMSVARGEIEHSASFFDYYASLSNLPIGEVLDVDPRQRITTRREPYGVIGVITPWNLPLNQAARACAPALAVGNTVVIKPAEATSQTTIALARLASEVRFPAGVLNVVLGAGTEVGSALVAHPEVRKVAFTGSVAVGKSIGRVAADKVMPLTLELGGKSANIVFEDADLDRAVVDTVRAFTNNGGQVCSAGSRLLVQSSIFDEFVARVVTQSERVRPGTDYGPMITPGQYAQVQDYFNIAASEGAVALTGGRLDDEGPLAGGFYVAPTVYTGVDNEARISREEIFGPVLVAMPFDTEDEAIRIANDSEFGLVAGVWTNDIARAIRVSEELEVGQVFINSWSTGAVQASFGGHKNSGYGREKGIEALNHYSHLKSITIVL